MKTILENKSASHNGRAIVGVILFLVGGALLIDQLDLFFVPDWVFSWPMLLIAIGVFIGARSNFQNLSWAVVSFIGLAFLLDDILPGLLIGNFIWPAALILLGVYLIMRRSHYFKS